MGNGVTPPPLSDPARIAVLEERTLNHDREFRKLWKVVWYIAIAVTVGGGTGIYNATRPVSAQQVIEKAAP